jgi:hypothetical protein
MGLLNVFSVQGSKLLQSYWLAPSVVVQYLNVACGQVVRANARNLVTVHIELQLALY